MIQNKNDKIQRIQSEKTATILSNNSFATNRTQISPFTACSFRFFNSGNFERIKLIYVSNHLESEQNSVKNMEGFDSSTNRLVD